MVDAMESLEALLHKERTRYSTCDYLGWMQAESNGDEATETIIEDVESSCSLCDSPSNSGSEIGGKSDTNRKRRDCPSSLDGDNDSQCTRPVRKKVKTFDSRTATSSQGPNSGINKHWREKICEWAYQVVDHFDLSREIVSIAVNHMDRYLSASPSAIEKSSFQLLSLTCLYLAIKLNEVRIIKIPGSKSTMDTLHQLSRGFFSLKDMEEMERDILQRLQWHVHPPTPQQFLKTILFLTVNEEDDFAKELYGLANFQVELAVLDYYFASYKLSEIAMASFLNALDELDPTNKTSCRWTLSHILDGFYVDKANVAACRRRLALIYSENNTASAAMHSTSIQGAGDGRTASPVCVMDPPMA